MEPNIWIHFVVSGCSSFSRMPLFEVPTATFQGLKITTWSPIIEDINHCRVLVKMRIYPLPQFQTPRSTWRNGLGNDTRYPNTGRACWISRMNRPLKPMTTQPRRHQGGNMIWSFKRNIIFWRLNIYAIRRFESIWMIVINLDEETHSKSHWSTNIPSWSAILAHFLAVSTHTITIPSYPCSSRPGSRYRSHQR